MRKVLIVYFSSTGNTEKMAQMVAEGAGSVPRTNVTVKSVVDCGVDELERYDGIIMGSPTYYGTMAYQLKKLLDGSVVLHGRLSGRVGAAFASSANVGGGNETTVLSILSAFLIHGMIVRGMEKGDHYGTVSIAGPDQRVKEQCVSLGKSVAELAHKVR